LRKVTALSHLRDRHHWYALVYFSLGTVGDNDARLPGKSDIRPERADQSFEPDFPSGILRSRRSKAAYPVSSLLYCDPALLLFSGAHAVAADFLGRSLHRHQCDPHQPSVPGSAPGAAE